MDMSGAEAAPGLPLPVFPSDFAEAFDAIAR
jgi:hypothetical protein